MADRDEDQDKPYDPTPRKLEQARERGDVPKSVDLTTAATYGGFLAVALFFGGETLAQISTYLSYLLAHANEIEAHGAGKAAVGAILGATSIAVAPWFVVPLLFAVAALFVQKAWVAAPEKVSPKLSRVSLISNAKQKFGRDGLFEFAKSTTKLLILAVCLAFFLIDRLPEMMATIAMEPAGATLEMLHQTVGFFGIVLVVAAAIGVVDYLWKQAEFLRTNRMSRQELMDEMKDTEGDPHIKQQRRQKGYDIATNRMIADVPGADVVIVNPTHYAVALRWERSAGGAPVCVAKGTDEVAARIRMAASEAGVPIHRDPPTARALHATIEIGQQILPEHYRPVAAAIRFAEAMRARARGRKRS